MDATHDSSFDAVNSGTNPTNSAVAEEASLLLGNKTTTVPSSTQIQFASLQQQISNFQPFHLSSSLLPRCINFVKMDSTLPALIMQEYAELKHTQSVVDAVVEQYGFDEEAAFLQQLLKVKGDSAEQFLANVPDFDKALKEGDHDMLNHVYSEQRSLLALIQALNTVIYLNMARIRAFAVHKNAQTAATGTDTDATNDDAIKAEQTFDATQEGETNE